MNCTKRVAAAKIIKVAVAGCGLNALFGISSIMPFRK
jgi:hypothetical protein